MGDHCLLDLLLGHGLLCVARLDVLGEDHFVLEVDFLPEVLVGVAKILMGDLVAVSPVGVLMSCRNARGAEENVVQPVVDLFLDFLCAALAEVDPIGRVVAPADGHVLYPGLVHNKYYQLIMLQVNLYL